MPTHFLAKKFSVYSKLRKLKKLLLVLLVITITLSLGFHAIQLEHHHGEFHEENAAATAFHLIDEKILIALLLIFSFWTVFKRKIQKLVLQNFSILFQLESQLGVQIVFDPIKIALQKGILHPKICG